MDSQEANYFSQYISHRQSRLYQGFRGVWPVYQFPQIRNVLPKMLPHTINAVHYGLYAVVVLGAKPLVFQPFLAP